MTFRQTVGVEFAQEKVPKEAYCSTILSKWFSEQSALRVWMTEARHKRDAGNDVPEDKGVHYQSRCAGPNFVNAPRYYPAEVASPYHPIA